jgi:hypothetical protein
MNNLTLTILIGIITSIIASIVIHFSLPLIKNIGKKITLFFVKSNKKFEKYITKKMSNGLIDRKINFVFLSLIAFTLLIGLGLVVLELNNRLESKSEITQILEKKNLEVNAENYSLIKEERVKSKKLSELGKILSSEYFDLTYYGIIILLGIIYLYIILSFVIIMTIRGNIEKFRKSIEVIRPEIGESEYFKIKRDWLIMKTFKDYNKIYDFVESHLNE